ncbi:hypothetical protein ACFYXH_36030 [Streptomyces sp. NPDC002730]|uniref:hypothetical protein n=1 Tax=Streptomyces sp. NPDC002730 TaxID=3364662 RepID=UPI0036D10CE0
MHSTLRVNATTAMDFGADNVQLHPRAAWTGQFRGGLAGVVDAGGLAVLDVAGLAGLLRDPEQQRAAINSGVRSGIYGRAGEQRGGRHAVAERANDRDGGPELDGGVGRDVLSGL